MRSFKSLTILGLVLVACMSLTFIGCGSDDAPTSNVGSLTDPNFVAIQDQVESLADSTFAFILAGMQSASAVSVDGDIIPFQYSPAFSDSDQISISYVNGWHIVNLLHSTIDFSFSVLDSVQFYNNDGISQLGINADSIWFRHHWNYAVQDQNVSYTTIDGSAGFDFRGLNTSIATIDGSNDFVVENQYVSVDSTVVRNFDFASTFSNLTVSKTSLGWIQSCPTSGTIATSLSMTYTKNDSTPVTTTWDIAMTFTDGSAAVTVSNGSLLWSYTTDMCTVIN